jgi:hypothetical protein
MQPTADHVALPFFRALAFAVLTLADAAAALRARSRRAFAVMVSSDRLPPILPPFRPCSLKNSKISMGILGLSIWLKPA